MNKLFAILLFTGLIFSCNNSKKEKLSAFDIQNKTNNHPGKKLMETNCYLCHSPTASNQDRIGPPMIAIKEHYKVNNISKEDFITSIQDWIKNPNAKNAKMPNEVKRFGVMPKQYYPEKTIAQIAEYLYDFEIEQPNWYKSSNKNNTPKQPTTANFKNLPYADRGLKYALTTKAVLGKNLMGTIQKKGTIEALSFCNERAYPLTDSMAIVHKANIKRVSDKPRNPNNKANLEELNYINTFKQVISKGDEPQPIVKETENNAHVYYPIITNNMCLQCHGKPNKTIEKATLNKINTLYPNDKAIGYNINEVRGIWSISFEK
ncbi:DUF3365 domain-containing protein [Seonamhaeicola sp.]|uniref:c-type heme family protein n=1 Tax=Seonamhaeicola sp. TaxID=1912245 RepID=UPI003562B9E6